MKIKFKKGDPRAGMVVEFDSSRGQELVDAGSADIYKENASEPVKDEPVKDEQKPNKKKAK